MKDFIEFESLNSGLVKLDINLIAIKPVVESVWYREGRDLCFYNVSDAVRSMINQILEIKGSL